MSAILLKAVRIIDPNSADHGKKRDILIQKGRIENIAPNIEAKRAKVISAKGLCVSPGWLDLRANFREPGDEYKETLESGSAAALAGGWKKVVLMPSTHPVADRKTAIDFIARQSSRYGVQLLPAGSLSEKMDGKQLAELFDMESAGAVAFTDDKQEVNTELMSRALEYCRNFDGLVMSFPFDGHVVPGGMMHEGPTSVSMGLKGIPPVAEELRLSRDIDLLRYTGGKLHVSLISTAKSVELIRKAKREGLAITCAVAAHQLSFLDADMEGFDSNLKVLPPFRSAADRKALIAGLLDGTIDAICSDHSPEDVEHKVREFEYANYGISSIQTAFCSAYTALESQISADEIAELFCFGPHRVLGLVPGVIEAGAEVDLTVFSTEESTVFSESDWKSKSMNSPFIGKTLKGKVFPITED